MPSATYKISDRYRDPVTNCEYVCTFPGDKTTSKWVPVGGALQQFRIVEDKGDYLNCIPWDGNGTSGGVVQIAKPYKLRTSIASETIQGVVHTYTYAVGATSTNVSNLGAVLYYVRTNSWVVAGQTLSETETVTPDYIVDPNAVGVVNPGDIIYAAAFSTLAPASLAGVTLIDVNVDGRAWAA